MTKKLPERLFLFFTSWTVVIIFSCATADSGNCGQFKNGKFIFRPHGQQGDVVFSISRQDSIQIETDKRTGYYSKLSVRWTDKCKYEAILLETTFPFPDSIQNIRRAVPLRTEIIIWTKDYYVFKSHRENSPIMTDTMWVEK